MDIKNTIDRMDKIKENWTEKGRNIRKLKKKTDKHRKKLTKTDRSDTNGQKKRETDQIRQTQRETDKKFSRGYQSLAKFSQVWQETETAEIGQNIFRNYPVSTACCYLFSYAHSGLKCYPLSSLVRRVLSSLIGAQSLCSKCKR